MLFKIMVLDTVSTDMRKYADFAVWHECGFELSGHTFSVSNALSSVVDRECDLVFCVDRPSSVLSVDFLRKARSRNIDIPTIVISHVESTKNIRECFLLGAIDCLAEPIEQDDLRDALTRASEYVCRGVMNTEYSKAVESALQNIELTDSNASLMEKLREFLAKTQGKAVSVEQAADYFGFNPDYFRRYFKQRAGISFSDFYKRLLMDYAGLLLHSGHYRVNEVSELLGFSSPDYFTRVFKKVTGKLPSDLKK